MSELSGTILSASGAAALAAAVAFAPAQAAAQEQAQRQASPVYGLFSQRDNPESARYATPDGAVQFVFDRTYGRFAFVRFEGDPEVHVLRPRMASDGNEVYATQDGAMRLVFTPHGGITVYTRSLRTGAAAAEVERAEPLTPAEVAFARFQARLRQLQAEARRRTGRVVTFDVPVPTNQPVPGVVLDAAERAADGIASAPMTVVTRVTIRVGPEPRARIEGDALNIQVTPQLGYAGRPSSATIRNVVTGVPQGPER